RYRRLWSPKRPVRGASRTRRGTGSCRRRARRAAALRRRRHPLRLRAARAAGWQRPPAGRPTWPARGWPHAATWRGAHGRRRWTRPPSALPPLSERRARWLPTGWPRSRCSPPWRAGSRGRPWLSADLVVQEERDDETEDDEGLGDHQVDQDLTESFRPLGERAGAGGTDRGLSDTYGDGRETDREAGADGDEACTEAGSAHFLGEREAAEERENREADKDTCYLLHDFPPTNRRGLY